ncbi:class I SAM-dependent methyltransferase [Caldimonas brevitalea]|uniref:SAM-dependent methyltransferase n=1 Tax=Caldimonas brevitalea TaxID=413882 RepID=A0A0G3BC87_9BURK|nr:class I SAM-dependent methyltransferase [Caldimonas brevitalea]AKJ26927.1 SAM-dependent methyltransferase [Caldimonas brevitalea]
MDPTAPNARTFDVGSQDYARYRPRYPSALFAHLASLAPSRALAWDCGTGNGQAAVALAAHFDAVVATDVSAEQLQAAESHPRVRYQQVPAEQAQFTRHSVDLLTVAQAVHWFDLPRFYAAARQALAPRGVIAVFGYGFFEGDAAIAPVLRATLLDPIAPYWSAGNLVLQRGYRDLPFPFEPLVSPSFEIVAHWTLDDMLGYVGTWSALKRHHEAGHPDPREAARARLAPLWGEGAREVRMPLALRVGRVGPDAG